MAQVSKHSLYLRREYAFYAVLMAQVQPLFWNLLRLPCHLRHPLWILHDTDDL